MLQPKAYKRKIIHIDMDAFYAAVEQQQTPEYRGKPLVVGSNNSRGVVAAASYEARAYGVYSAMPSTTAKLKCPDLIFVAGNFSLYKSISKQIRQIFFEYTDLVEPLSLDEAYLDVTINKYNNPSASIIAQEIRKKIFNSTQLTASAGVSYNKFLAKMASDINKPNGIKVIKPIQAQSFMDELAIEKFYGVGQATANKFKKLGIYNGKQLKEKSLDWLQDYFGKSAYYYYKVSRAIDDREVISNRLRKSIGVEHTYPDDIADKAVLLDKTQELSIEVWEKASKLNKAGRCLTLKVKLHNFQIITRSLSLDSIISSQEHIFTCAKILLNRLIQQHPNKIHVRLLGITLSNLIPTSVTNAQLELEL
jgi:DNA polymerase IV